VAVTATGSPGEELLDSTEPEPEPKPRARRWLAAATLVGAVLAALFGFQALQPDPVPDQPVSTPTSTSAAADPSLVDASARRIYGELEPDGLQNFSTAVRAATDVVRIHCRADIPSWSASLISSGEAYDEAVFLMSPANRAFGTFVVQVELTWSVDHYAYAVVAGHAEQCR
jgi:hypothetical protein